MSKKIKSFNNWSNLFVVHESELLREDIIELLKHEFPINNYNEMYQLLMQRKIVPFGAHILKSLENEMNIENDYWSNIHEKYLVRNINIKNEMIRLFEYFELNHVKSICLFENFGTILLANSCLGCFSSGDVDLNADKAEKEVINNLLIQLGYKSKKRRGVSEEIMSSFYIHGVIPENDFWVNIEWKPIARSYIHTMKKLQERLAFLRAHESIILENGIRLLNPTAMIYFNLLHISIGHYYNVSPGIRLYVDVDRLSRAKSIDWNSILKWASEDKQEIRIATSIKLCRYFLNSPLPEITFIPKIEKRSNQIVDYLYNKKSKSFLPKVFVHNQILIDSLSEDVSLVAYMFRRLISLNRN